MGTHPIFESDFDCLTEIVNRDIMDVELFGILRKFDAIGQSVVSEEMTLDEGLVRYREYLEVVKETNTLVAKDTEMIKTGTKSVSHNQIRLKGIAEQMDNCQDGYKIICKLPDESPKAKEPEEDKENQKPEKLKGKPKSKRKEWEKPMVEQMKEEDFEALGRHDKGRLKFTQITHAINQMNEQLKSKYELLGRYKAKMKLSPGAKMEAQEIFDQEAKLSETFYNIDENLLAKCAFYRLRHTKSLIINILKNQGRLLEKRQGKLRIYYFPNVSVERLPITKP